jgi:hypothetical protein
VASNLRWFWITMTKDHAKLQTAPPQQTSSDGSCENRHLTAVAKQMPLRAKPDTEDQLCSDEIAALTAVRHRSSRVRRLTLLLAWITGVSIGTYAEICRGFSIIQGWLGAVPQQLPVLMVLAIGLSLVPAFVVQWLIRQWRTEIWLSEAAELYVLTIKQRARVSELLKRTTGSRGADRRLEQGDPEVAHRSIAEAEDRPTGTETNERSCGICNVVCIETGRCPRCGRILCLGHIPVAARRCVRCEDSFLSEQVKLSQWRWFAVGFAPPWFGFASVAADLARMPRCGGWLHITTGFPIVDGVIMTVVLAFAFGAAAVRLHMWSDRRKFLKQRLPLHS